MTKKAWLSWSSGKDSAFALSEIRASRPDLQVDALITTVNETYGRVAMHAVRRDLLARRAEALGLDLHEVLIPVGCTERLYEEKMAQAVIEARSQGVVSMIFGDLYLQDVRAYRVNALNNTGIEPVFPLWLRPTSQLAQQIIDSGIRAILTCVDPRLLSESFAGREYDASLLRDLPKGVDPCGENGEFHTFVYDSPLFKSSIPIRVGERVARDGFVFADIHLA